MRKFIFPLFVLISLFVLHLWSLMRFPSPFVDEAWLASRAWGYIQTGMVSGPLDVGLFDYIDGYWKFLPLFPTWLHSLSLRLFEIPNLISVRSVSLLFGFILLGAIYWIGEILSGRRLALLSVIIVSLSYSFFYSAHLARYDIIAASIGYMAIALYLADRQARRIWVGFLIGLLLVLAVEVHPNSTIFIPATLCLYVLDLRKWIFQNRQAIGFVAGVLLGVILYTAIHILPYPENYLIFNSVAFNATHAPPIFTLNALILLRSFYETGEFLAVILLLLFPVTILSYIYLLKKRTPEAVTLFLLVTTMLLSYVCLIELKIGYYAIFITPILLIMVARYLLHAAESPWKGSWSDYLGKTAWGLLLITFVFNLSFLRQNSYELYLDHQNALREFIVDEDIIMGPQIYWFGFFTHRYLFMEQIGYYRQFFPQDNLEEVMMHFHPSVLIADNHLNGFLEVDAPDRSELLGYLSVSEIDFKDVVNKHSKQVGAYDSSLYGLTRVYRFDW